MKICVYNLGCKVNQYECDSLINAFFERGFFVTDKLEVADIFILNTCAVTSEAERKSRQAVSRCKKLNEKARIIVCGCASQNDSSQFFEKKGVTYVSGVAKKAELVDKLHLEGVFVETLPTVYEDDFAPHSLRTRSYVKIQDGCNNFCSYCLIPYLRGRSRSRSIDSIRGECFELAKKSNEIVLTGINLSGYGEDCGSSLAKLLQHLGSVPCRIRIGSLEVNVIDENLLNVLSNMENFCPHFHLSLQSGDDSVLLAMNRHYNTRDYESRVKLIRKFFPNCSLTTDLICGFPKEGEAEFEKTLAFIKAIGFSDIHIFPYSPRSGTKAYPLGRLSGEIVRSRVERVEAAVKLMREQYCKTLLGKELNVLFEEGDGREVAGFSANYVKVYAEASVAKAGEMKIITPTMLYKNGVK